MPPRPREPFGTRLRRGPDLVVDRVSVEPSASRVHGTEPAPVNGTRERPAPLQSASPAGAFGPPAAGIDIRWTEDGACVVELSGRPTRAMLAKARDLLWSRSPTDRLTIVVSEAVLTRELFAMLIAGRRRLSASGVFEIVGLDAPGALHIADSLRPPR